MHASMQEAKEPHECACIRAPKSVTCINVTMMALLFSTRLPFFFILFYMMMTLFTLSKCTTLTIVSICRVSAWFFSLSLSSSDVACLVLTRHRSVLSSSLQPTLQQRQINTFSFLFYTKNGMTEFDFQK